VSSLSLTALTFRVHSRFFISTFFFRHIDVITQVLHTLSHWHCVTSHILKVNHESKTNHTNESNTRITQTNHIPCHIQLTNSKHCITRTSINVTVTETRTETGAPRSYKHSILYRHIEHWFAFVSIEILNLRISIFILQKLNCDILEKVSIRFLGAF